MYPLQSIDGDSAASIAASIERAVGEGSLAPGTRLPPIRDVAEHLDLATGTVARGYATLRDRGVVATRGRRGTIVRAASVLAPRHPPMPEPAGAVNLAIGEPGRHPDVAEALAAAASRATGYPSRATPPELPELRAVLDAAARADGIPVDHGVLVPGTMYGIELALDVHLRPGDSVAVEDPGWGDHLDLLTSMGLQLEPVAIDERGMRPHDLARVVDRVAAVVLTPRAHNPAGAALDPVRRDELAGILAGRDLLVIEDDHAADIAGVDLAAVATDPVTDRWIMVRSLSKSWGADLRMAVVHGDDFTVPRMRGRLRLSPGWVSRWLQAVALHLLESPEARRTVAELRAGITAAREGLVADLGRHGIAVAAPSGLNVWVPVPDEAATTAALLARGWVVMPGERFRVASPPAIRITAARITPAQSAGVAADLAAILAGADPAASGSVRS